MLQVDQQRCLVDELREEQALMREKGVSGERALREVKNLREQLRRSEEASAAAIKEWDSKEQSRDERSKANVEAVRQARRKIREEQQQHAATK